ncbi:BTB/POZ and MATH domain-containing protein 2-like [Carex rostrata]
MASSAQAISHQSLQTASAIRTETITGSHLFNIFGYSLTKGIGIGKSINSDIFTVGEYNWIIKFFPDGSSKDDQNFISICLQLETEATDVKALISFDMLQQNGEPYFSIQYPAYTNWTSKHPSRGYPQFANRAEFEASGHLKNDALSL